MWQPSSEAACPSVGELVGCAGGARAARGSHRHVDHARAGRAVALMLVSLLTLNVAAVLPKSDGAGAGEAGYRLRLSRCREPRVGLTPVTVGAGGTV